MPSFLLPLATIPKPAPFDSRLQARYQRIMPPEIEPASKTEPIVLMEKTTKSPRELMESLRGLLKDELAEYGGGAGFIRWIRDDEEPIKRPVG